MPRLLYTLCFYLLVPVILLRLIWRGLKAPAYRSRLAERFGWFKAPPMDKPLWIHAVSVGETIAAAPLINRLLAENPAQQIIVTTMTPTGSERVQALFGGRVFHVYAPYDLPDAIARFLKRCQPSALIVMETELWPNLINGCYRRNIPVLVANARLSARSAKGYARFGTLSRGMLQQISRIAAQHQEDGQRFIQLGLPADRLSVTGSIKFDLELPGNLYNDAQALRQQLGSERPIWIAASTHAGEDELLLQAHKSLLNNYPDLLLILVPRHPERFDQVYRLCCEQNLSTARRSLDEPCRDQTRVLLGDTMGELMLFYGAGDIAFVGGSLIANGGHNPLEPAALGLPVLMGPHLFNFSHICSQLQEAGGLHVVEADAQAIEEALESWLTHPEQREAAGQAAQGVVNANQGALTRLCGLIETDLLGRESHSSVAPV